MDLISKYLNLSEAWPGTPEWKKKHDPSYNPYDPEGKVRKALKLKPYGYRDSKPASDEDETPSEQPAMKKRGRPKKMKEEAEIEESSIVKFSTDADSYPSHIKQITKIHKSLRTDHPDKVFKSFGGDGTTGFVKVKNKAHVDAVKTYIRKAGGKIEEEVEHIEELKSSTMMSYKDKANKEIKALDTEVKTGEYKDIAANIMNRRMKGVDRAANKLATRKEEVEEIEELSKSTLASYAKKAAGSSSTASKIASRSASLSGHESKPMLDIVSKRTLGIKKAVNRLAKEEVEEIEELSKATLASYAKKATRDARIKMATGKDFERIATKSRKPAYKAAAATWERRYKSDARKREAGVEKAIDRLAKEEVELEEISNMAHAKYRSAARADIRAQSKMLDADNKANDRIEKRVAGLARSTGLERVKKMTKEEVVQKYLNVEQADDVPFKADKPKQSATPGKYGVGYSTARHLARMGLKAAIKDLKKGPEAGKKQIS